MSRTDPSASIDINSVYRAIHTLYSPNDAITPPEKQAASSWLMEFQRSVYSWAIADQLLHSKYDLNSCYFAANTLRNKIQFSFKELPSDAHFSLRDSLLQHIAAITPETDHSIVTQLCLAVTLMILQSNTWADPIGHLLNTFGMDARHWWPVLEILTLLPEEVHSRQLLLGDNRRRQFISHLESVAPTVLTFLKQCLAVSVSGQQDPKILPTDLCNISLVKCYGSWITMNPECFCTLQSSDVLGFAIMQLREGKCGSKMHAAATDCLSAVLEVVPDMDSTSNNNAIELQTVQINLHTAIMSFKEAYLYSLAEEDMDKTVNYCRIFSEYGENMVPYMLRSWRDVHYSIRIIDLILLCAQHHDYEVCETTFFFWNRLSEDLYHLHDDNYNSVFRPYVQQLLQSLYKHCQIEPDHEGLLTSSEEFFDFRRKASDLLQDIIFVVGGMNAFEDLGRLLLTDTTWEGQESALFLLYATAKYIDPANTAAAQPIVDKVLGWTDWRHICLRISAIRLLGGMSSWLNKNPQRLENVMQFLVQSLPTSNLSNASAAALQVVCEQCAEHIAQHHMDGLLALVAEMDRYNVSNEAVIGLLKGIGHVVSKLPRENLAQVTRQVSWSQLQPLQQIVLHVGSFERNTKNDPAFWIDRLSALFRNISLPSQNGDIGNQEHPCKAVMCEDIWPVMSKVCDKFQADVRVMERVCRCLRFVVRCLGKHSHPFLQPLAIQLVNMYSAHHHSCFLYLGSVLVDEYGSEPQCAEGLITMLATFVTPTFAIFNAPEGLRSHPDTVDDFFRLCTRYMQRCSMVLLKSNLITPLVQCAQQAALLDHREANVSVMKFLFDLVHAGRKNKESHDFSERRFVVRSVLILHGPALVNTLIHAVIFTLPTYTMHDICDLLFELRETVPEEFGQWLEAALKQLPDKTQAGNQTATIEQLEEFHGQAIRSRNVKDLNKILKDFCRLYR